jgi:phage shock protein A
MATLEFIKQQIADISRNYGDAAKSISEHSRELERLNIQHEVLRHDVDRAHDKIREFETKK